MDHFLFDGGIPGWASHTAYDEDGGIYAYSHQPEPDDLTGGWLLPYHIKDGRVLQIGKAENLELSDWKESLRSHRDYASA